MPYNNESKYILTARCPDTTGISASVFNYIHENDGFITSTANFGDPTTNTFFMRIVFTGVGPKMGTFDDLKAKFQPIADRFSMQWEINECSHRPRVLIAVSKFGHCLIDLLHKTKAGQIPMEIAGVVSNHPDMKGLAEWYGVNYYYFPVTPETKLEQEERILDLINEQGIELMVLARYMQILSPKMCEALTGRCINIHHSFLPSFKGAKPYSQAHQRGVKIVGATAHYATPDLDEGPIIEQAVERIDHNFTVEDIGATVRDLETLTLSRAVRWHVEKRILLNGSKTVVFK